MLNETITGVDLFRALADDSVGGAVAGTPECGRRREGSNTVPQLPLFDPP
jgi:hypothetical protein